MCVCVFEAAAAADEGDDITIAGKTDLREALGHPVFVLYGDASKLDVDFSRILCDQLLKLVGSEGGDDVGGVVESDALGFARPMA